MKKNILLIDDDDSFQYMFRRSCQKIESVKQVSIANHGQEGIDVLLKLVSEGMTPHYIFVDINMPVMDGFEFLEQYKVIKQTNEPLFKVILIAMLTSSMNAIDRKKSMDTGVASAYIIKPEDIQQTRNMVRNLLGV